MNKSGAVSPPWLTPVIPINVIKTIASSYEAFKVSISTNKKINLQENITTLEI